MINPNEIQVGDMIKYLPGFGTNENYFNVIGIIEYRDSHYMVIRIYQQWNLSHRTMQETIGDERSNSRFIKLM